jgi:hypothetical protein
MVLSNPLCWRPARCRHALLSALFVGTLSVTAQATPAPAAGVSQPFSGVLRFMSPQPRAKRPPAHRTTVARAHPVRVVRIAPPRRLARAPLVTARQSYSVAWSVGVPGPVYRVVVYSAYAYPIAYPVYGYVYYYPYSYAGY